MNVDINSKITDLMKDLVYIRDGRVFPQILTVYLAKTSTEDESVSKLPTKSGNPRTRRLSQSEKSERVSTAEDRDRSHRSSLSKRPASQLPVHATSRPLSSAQRYARASTTSSSQLPLTLQNSTTYKPKIVAPRTLNHREIATKIEAQTSNLKLTTDLREALISTIFTKELQLRSKLDAQEKELFSSPKSEDIRRRRTSLKPGPTDKDNLKASLMQKRLELESIRAAQERLIFSPTEQEVSETIPIPTPNIALQAKHATPERTRRKSLTSSRGRQSTNGPTRSLTPILEASEVDLLEVEPAKNRDGRNILEGQNRSNLKTIKAQENLRQQRMESELPSGLIQDTDASSLLRHSDDSDSLDELVIKNFAIHVVQSEPDAALSSLPITEQAIIESNKLKETIESVKQRFQVKVARDKFAERVKQNIQVPKTQVIKSSNPSTSDSMKPSQINPRIYYKDDVHNSSLPTATRTTPVNVNIIDSYNWGDAALPKPLFEYAEPAEELVSTSEEDFLNEKDMQFDDLFGEDNVSAPVTSRKEPQQKVQQNHRISTQSQIRTEKLLDTHENVEDLEDPQFSDISLDESKEINRQVNFSEKIEKFDDPKFTSNEMTDNSTFEQLKGKIKTNNKQQPNPIESVPETQHEKDLKKIKELLDSGALRLSITNQRFEEGVLDLLLRQSNSLWDPVVGGIPISYCIPSQNHEKGLLDTSINETNLEPPLIKKSEKKLPEYMESLENEWKKKIEKNIEPTDVNDDEHILVQGIPKFSYEPLQQNRHRRKVHNIMDSEDESEESDEILNDHEMNFDDLTNNIAEPTYDFKTPASIFDNLEIKMRILRRLKENNEPSAKPLVANQRDSHLSKQKNTSTPLEEFIQNKPQFNTFFGILNETNNENYVDSNNIDLLCNRTPTIDSRIIRNVDNCRYHLELMKLIYKKMKKYLSQEVQPDAFKTYNSFNEIIKKFNKIKDGRICARIQSCPKNSHERGTTASQATQANNYKKQPKRQQRVHGSLKIRKSVSFADSVDENEASKSRN